MKQILKSLAVGVVLAIVGYVAAPMLFSAEIAAGIVFASGLLLGGIAGGLLSGAGRIAGAGKKVGELRSIFIGNLSFKARPEDVRELFAPYGEVHSVRIMTDRQTRRPRGFAFVEMAPSDAKHAIKALNNSEFLGRTIRVNEGTERKPREN